MKSTSAGVSRSVKIVLWIALGIVSVLAVVAFSLSYMIMTGDFRAGNTASAIGSLRTINDCAAKYALEHPQQGYPSTLAFLGSKDGKCIDAQLESGTQHGFTFTYRPGPVQAKGGIKTYSITAQPIHFGRTGNASFFSDESSAIRMTREHRAATVADPPLQ